MNPGTCSLRFVERDPWSTEHVLGFLRLYVTVTWPEGVLGFGLRVLMAAECLG